MISMTQLVEILRDVRQKQVSILNIALATGMRADTRVDEAVAENAQDCCTQIDEAFNLLGVLNDEH